MKKRAITLTLALLMCLSCALPASSAGGSRFTDVPDNAWYAEAVNAMADGGILYGKGDGRFDPDAPVTLAELSAIYCRLRGYEVKAEYGHWAGSAMYRTGLGAEWNFGDFYGMIYADHEGCTEFPYADSPAYRADAFSLFAGWVYTWQFFNYAGLADYIPGYSDFDKSKIPDRDEYISACNCEEALNGEIYYVKNGHYYKLINIDYAYDLGLTHGVDANFTCDAFGTLTRAQLAQMCYNMGWTSADAYASFMTEIHKLIGLDWLTGRPIRG